MDEIVSEFFDDFDKRIEGAHPHACPPERRPMWRNLRALLYEQYEADPEGFTVRLHEVSARHMERLGL